MLPKNALTLLTPTLYNKEVSLLGVRLWREIKFDPVVFCNRAHSCKSGNELVNREYSGKTVNENVSLFILGCCYCI